MAKKEAAVEIVEEAVDAVERIPNVNLNGTTKRQQLIILGVTAVVSGASVGGVTYFLTKKHFRMKYEQLAKDEIAEAKRFYSILHKKDDYATPEAALETLHGETPPEEPPTAEKIIQNLGYKVEAPKKTEAELVEDAPDEKAVNVVTNVFMQANSDDDFDYEEEMRNRSTDTPYILTHDEFLSAEKDYQQITLTYFEEDDVLADSRDQPIEDVDSVVGSENLNRFGHGSNDKNVVYIRNEKGEVEFEINRSNGSYAREVLGFDPSLEHADRPRRRGPRKFRSDDG